MKKKELQKKSLLGGNLNQSENRQYKKLKKIKLPDEKVTLRNPLTGNTKEIMLVRTGTTEQALAKILWDQDIPSEQKDAMISMYLFERGKESASFLADIYQFKGQHTKETRAFKSQMRFDYEMMIRSICQFFEDTAHAIERNTKEGKSSNWILKDLGNRFESAAEKFLGVMNNITEQRMREKGHGIYISRTGQIFDEKSTDLVDVVKKDLKNDKKRKK